MNNCIKSKEFIYLIRLAKIINKTFSFFSTVLDSFKRNASYEKIETFKINLKMVTLHLICKFFFNALNILILQILFLTEFHPLIPRKSFLFQTLVKLIS